MKNTNQTVITPGFIIMHTIALLVVLNAIFAGYLMINNPVPNRTEIDTNRAAQEVCQNQNGVQNIAPINTKQGYLSAITVTCKSGYSQVANPHYPTAEFLAYQKQHPWLSADDERLAVSFIYFIGSFLGGLFGLVMLLNMKWLINHKRQRAAQRANAW